MRLLLDTHFLIWLIRDPGVLSPSETAIVRGGNSLMLSVVSIWELRIKWNTLDRNGQRKGNVDPEVGLSFADDQRLDVHPLTRTDCTVQLMPPLDHKDPFDEMLLVHAQQLRARLLTRDARLADHPVALIA